MSEEEQKEKENKAMFDFFYNDNKYLDLSSLRNNRDLKNQLEQARNDCLQVEQSCIENAKTTDALFQEKLIN